MPETLKAAPKRAAKPRAAKGASKTIVIEQYRSGICCNFSHKRVLRALGLRKIRQRVTRTDNDAVRGMVDTIPHLVRIVEA
ncbi:MAG TPA: 50S ribosomal protein L30 [Candidatus Polarisedimenticolia bacterium]|nr:50S ribosomal protein L30 [Candidatus Polarisedimenticolia bacterium]